MPGPSARTASASVSKRTGTSNSKSAVIATPLLGSGPGDYLPDGPGGPRYQLNGGIYLRAPDPGATRADGLYGIFLDIEDAQTGIVVKLKGDVVPDERTGQLRAMFRDNPPLPFTDFLLEFKGGSGKPRKDADHPLELDLLIVSDPTVWRPLPGPQTMAYESTADVIGFGGAAGGGKTDLACGLALTKHKRSAMFRRVGTELVGIIDRLVELFGGRDGYNGQDKIWRRDGLQVELASVPNMGDERGHQGRPKDLLVIDEAANFLESQVRFLMGWVRTTDPT